MVQNVATATMDDVCLVDIPFFIDQRGMSKHAYIV